MQPQPGGRMAALQQASQGQPANPGLNFPAPQDPASGPGDPAGGPFGADPAQGQAQGSPLGPNVTGLPPELEAQAKDEAIQADLQELLARQNVLEQALIARGAIDQSDLDPHSSPAALGQPGMDPNAAAGGAPPPGAPPGAGAVQGPSQQPPPGAGAPPQPMGGGPKQPY